jgi:hypothetical protein
VLINTAAVRDNIRDMEMTLNIPELIKDGTVQYGMQSFDQSLMQLYSQGAISYESAMFYATSPAEFALRVQGVSGTSDTSWSNFEPGVGERGGERGGKQWLTAGTHDGPPRLAVVSSRIPDVQQSPDRQPGRDRAARDPRLPRAWRADGGGLLRG